MSTPSLPELQRRFGVALSVRHGWERARDLALDRTGRVAPELRLAAYRANVLGNLRDALRGAYPVVDAIVGKEFFVGLAREYALTHPSASGDLADYGAEFARFLAGFEPARELPYLPDVARLEWAVHRAYGAADHAPLNLARLARVPQSDWPRLRLRPHPAAVAVVSDYPLYRIWQLHQPGGESIEHIDLGSGGEAVLVVRPAARVEVLKVDAATARFFAACASGKRLEEALEPYLPLTELLAFLVEHSALVEFELA